MKNLNTIEAKVKVVLLSSSESRDDDMMLYLDVCNLCTANTGSSINNMSFEAVMRQYKTLGIPCFESVRRARQKLQAKYPELSSSTRVKRLRTKQEGVYKKYSKK